MSPSPGTRPVGVTGSQPSDPAFRVVVVCQANVCRSRAAEVLLLERAARADLALSVLSAGTRVDPRSLRCAQMDQLLRRRGSEPSPDAGTRPLDADLLEGADLVLVAEARHRAHAARLLPSSRTRTFTLLEAAALARALRTGAVVPSPTSGPDPGGASDPVHDLHAARGRVQYVTDEPAWRSWMPRRTATGVLDVADVHAAGRRPHERTVERIDTALTSVVEYLGARQVRA
jgi:protein-tyrosine phosphatase